MSGREIADGKPWPCRRASICEDFEEPCEAKPALAAAYRSKCAEVEELRKALRNARAALSCKDPVIADMERSCALSMIDKALEGKE